MNEAHDLLFEKVRFHYDSSDQRVVLRQALKNFRQDKGMSLEFEAFKYLADGNFYDFECFPRPRDLNSRELVLFDKLSTSPYYVGKTDIYISDITHQFTFGMVTTFAEMIAYLKV